MSLLPVLLCAVACAAAADAYATLPAALGSAGAGQVRLGELVGAPVHGRNGENAGVASDVVVDMHERRVAFALVAAGAGAPVLACVIASGGLAIQGASFVLPPAAETVSGVPSCSGAGWPRSAAPDAPRYVLGSELLRADLVGKDGERVGSLRDVVVHAGDARLAHALGDLGGGAGPATFAIRPLRVREGRITMPTLPGEGPPVAAAAG